MRVPAPSLAALRGFPVVLLNGPPRAGKDTAGRALRELPFAVEVMKFAGGLKEATHALFGIPPAVNMADLFEDAKDEPSEWFGGMSPRRAYITVSEVLTKPTLGRDHFGRAFVRRLALAHANGARLAVVTDCGFAEETAPVIEAVGKDAVLLIRVAAPARGCSFNGDSRSFIRLPGVAAFDIENDVAGSSEVFEATVVERVAHWLGVTAAGGWMPNTTRDV